jgi:hypothetical protein
MNKDFNVYKWRRDHLTENKTAPYTKRIGDLTWEDVANLTLPTGQSGGVRVEMKDYNVPGKAERMLQSWKDDLVNLFPNALNMEITIDRNNDSWSRRAVITDPEYVEAIKKKEAAFQAMYDKERGRYQGD